MAKNKCSEIDIAIGLLQSIDAMQQRQLGILEEMLVLAANMIQKYKEHPSENLKTTK